MRAVILPASVAGPVAAPPGKSWAHRLLICAGLADGMSTIRNIADSEDVLATSDCLRALGARIEASGGARTVTGTDLRRVSGAMLPCRESGSTLRFLIPLAGVSGEAVTLTGSERLLSRPLSVYEKLWAEQGISWNRSGTELHLRGQLKPGRFRISGNISSQFVSGLLFALPLLKEDSEVSLEGPVESGAYIEMTIEALRRFGVLVNRRDNFTLEIPGNQRCRAQELTVEGDWSNAAFFLALGAEVTGLDRESLQPDRICEEYFRRLDDGCAELDVSGCPDLAPVLMAYAALRNGAVLTGTSRLRFKESDRGEAMREELGKFGVAVDAEPDRITVGCGAKSPAEPLCGHNDHRIVMALAVLCCATGGTIDGAEAVSKSWPDFFDRLRAAGGSVRMED